jgi:hypothetical protein
MKLKWEERIIKNSTEIWIQIKYAWIGKSLLVVEMTAQMYRIRRGMRQSQRASLRIKAFFPYDDPLLNEQKDLIFYRDSFQEG